MNNKLGHHSLSRINAARCGWARRLRRRRPTRNNLVFTVFVVVLVLIGVNQVRAAPSPAAATLNTSLNTITYQGRLTDTNGTPLSGAYVITFRLYDVATGGTALWSEYWAGSDSVVVTRGLFSVRLGSLTAIPTAVITSTSNLWLGVSVGTDAEMTPRVQLGSAPYAFQANHATQSDRAFGLSAADGTPADAVTVDENGNVRIGTTNPDVLTKLYINGQGGLLRLWNNDPATVSSGYTDFSIGNTNAPVGGLNNWLSITSFGDGYPGVLSARGGQALSQNRVDQFYTDGEAMIFANYLDKPFYFYQGGGYSAPSRVAFTIAGNGNVGIGVSTPTYPLQLAGGAYSDGATWYNASDRNLKENFVPVNNTALLDKVAQLPISTWNYKTEGRQIQHIGPMAQDFYAAFRVGMDDTHISTVDTTGVALAAIQGLYRLTQDQQAQLTRLKMENASLQQQVTSMGARLSALEQGTPTAMAGSNGMLSEAIIIGAMLISGAVVYQKNRRAQADSTRNSHRRTR